MFLIMLILCSRDALQMTCVEFAGDMYVYIYMCLLIRAAAKMNQLPIAGDLGISKL